MKCVACASIALIGIAALTQQAQADTYVVRQSRSPLVACYDKVYVPAQVEVNTRGRLVRGTHRYWQTGDTAWNLVEEAPVFVQTQRTISPDHYTLVATPCPGN